mgnify:CR=1 FL=1
MDDDGFAPGFFYGAVITLMICLLIIGQVKSCSYDEGVMDREDNKVVVITNPVGKREIFPVDKIIGDAKVTVEKKDAEEVTR